jgi:hypothetical protein
MLIIRLAVNETRENERDNKGYNGTFGIELYLNEKTSWTSIN